jgi:hypothetical protein
MIGLTHKWSDQWRSTATYGYVNVDNTSQYEISPFCLVGHFFGPDL